MAKKTKLTQDELRQKLDQQLSFLKRSADAFDSGHEEEALRLAATVRVLVRDTNLSKSLLSQLNLKEIPFVDSSFNFDEENKNPHCGLVMMAVGKRNGFIPPLDSGPMQGKTLTFDDWWGAKVFKDSNGTCFSRKKIILCAAEEDGGVHVDPALTESYRALLKENTIGFQWRNVDGTVPVGSPVYPTIRQIAHEVLKSFDPTYQKKQDMTEGLFVGGMSLIVTQPHTYWSVGLDGRWRKVSIRSPM